jgi:hypothetical protein
MEFSRMSSHQPSLQREPRRRIRRRGLADHFDINLRTVDAWVKRGVLPAPHYIAGSVIPFWYIDEAIDRPPGKREGV